MSSSRGPLDPYTWFPRAILRRSIDSKREGASPPPDHPLYYAWFPLAILRRSIVAS